jgi:hypothetical protein
MWEYLETGKYLGIGDCPGRDKFTSGISDTCIWECAWDICVWVYFQTGEISGYECSEHIWWKYLFVVELFRYGDSGNIWSQKVIWVSRNIHLWANEYLGLENNIL